MENDGWERKKINTVNRYRNRGKYDFQTVNTIVDTASILHVSFSSAAEEGHPGFPIILPMLGCTSAYPDPDDPSKAESRAIYLHGYVQSRMMRLATESGESGIPLCVCATLVDGLVLGLTPNHHSCNYRSALIFGHATVVTDEKERLFAMELITDNLVPGRRSRTRYPNATELKSTGILRVEIESASAKVRAGTTGEDGRI